MDVLLLLSGVVLAAVLLHRRSDAAAGASDIDASEVGGMVGSVKDWGSSLEQKWEGFRSSVYLDGAGNPTIGYGHKVQPGEDFSGGVTQEQGQAMLEADMQKARDAVSSQVKVPLSSGQFAALVDWVFNLGPGRLKSSTLLKDLNGGDYDAARAQIPKWDYVNGAPSAGVEDRRNDEVSAWDS